MKKQLAIIAALALSVVLVFFSGCGKDEAPAKPRKPATKRVTNRASRANQVSTNVVAVKRAKKPKPLPLIDRMSATGVVVQVNGTNITKKEFSDWENLRLKLWAYANGKPLDGKDEDYQRQKNGNRTRVLGELIKRELIGRYAEGKGLKVGEDKMKATEKNFLKRLKKPKLTVDRLLAKIGREYEGSLKAAVEADALADLAVENFSTNDLFHVTEQEITNRIEYVRKWNENADRKNAEAKEKALKAKQEILNGGIFVDAAKKYSEFCPEQGDMWENGIRLDEFEGDNPLLKWLLTADVGDISDPIDLDDGISIVGLKAKYEGEAAEDGKPAVMEYDLVRCCFYAYERLEEIEDRSELIADMLDLRRAKAMEELRQSLIQNVEIEFPSGKNLFYAPKKPAKAKAKGKAGKGGKPKPKKKQSKETNVNKENMK